MTVRKGEYVCQIDRDDMLDNWLKRQDLCMTNSIFFEFEYTAQGYFDIIAGIDYCSNNVKFNQLTLSRHHNICNKLNRPYFFVRLIGHLYYKTCCLNQIDCYVIDYNLCNALGKETLNQMLSNKSILNYNAKSGMIYLSEQEYSNFLHRVRNSKIEPVDLCKDVYLGYLSYEKIVRERHALFGRTLYHSDIDLILYSEKDECRPVLIVEFKSNRYFSKALNGKSGQEKLLSRLAQQLSIPVIKMWHQEDRLDEFMFLNTYNNMFTIKQKDISGVDLQKLFKSYCHNY